MNLNSMNADMIRLLAVGDIFLGGEFLPYADKKKLSLHSPFKNIAPFINRSDILLVNLEGPLYNNGVKRSGSTAHLSNHQSLIDWLLKSQNGIVNLANNHILDYGYEDFYQTIRLLHDNNIQTIGAGIDAEQAYKPAIFNINSKSIAFAAYTTDEPHVGSVIAGEDKPGCASLSDIDTIIYNIINLKQNVDYVVVVLHWGFEYFQYPSPRQMEIAHKLVNAGANAIIGHHPHVIQGIEQFNDAFIFYSLGNFFFPSFRDSNGRLKYQKPLSKEFMVAEIAIDNRSDNHQMNVYGGKRNRNYNLQLYDGQDEARFYEKIESLSSLLTTPNYISFWNRYFKERKQEINIELLKEAFIRLFTLNPKETIGKLKVADISRNFNRLKNLLIN